MRARWWQIRPNQVRIGITTFRLFFFRYLNRLKELPEELNEEKFKDLTESAKVSKFSKKEFEAYRNMYHKIWKTSLFFVANSKCKDDARSYDC